jgi:hypothetical protein
MSLNRSNPRATPRWLVAGLAVVSLSVLAVSAAVAAYPNPPVTTIPGGYFTVTDSDGPNDVPAQSDVTQMGRDDSNEDVYKIFWSWDEIDQWTGSGQTGDACALFDSDGDGKINEAVCARVSNTNADTTIVELVPQDADHPVYFFACSDAKNDRCTQPDGPLPYVVETMIDAGVLGSAADDAPPPGLELGNLITETDPFYQGPPADPVGSDFPRDTTLEIFIQKGLLDVNSTLVNVCSYPSAGNGGNNNPFDCVVSPGGGFLSIVKDAQPDTTTETFSFSVTKNQTTLGTRQILGDNTADPLAVLLSNSPVVITETNIPTDWDLDSVSCTIEDDGSTGAFDADNDRVTGVQIQSGKITTCTFVDKLTVGTLIVQKTVVNDDGGSMVATDFAFKVNGGSAVSFLQDGSNTLAGKNTLTVNVGTTYSVVEDGTPIAGYTTTYSGCSNITLTGGETKTCTITNDDQAGTLIVKKVVTNDNGGTSTAGDFAFSVSGPTASSGTAFDETEATDDNDAETGENVLTVDAGTYDVTEDGTPIAGYSTSYSNCTDVVVANGGTATCTITNDDDKASPAGTTIQSWVLHDSISITGIRDGGSPAASVTFRLYTGCTDDVPSGLVGSEIDGSIVSGAASTTTGFAVSDSGDYYWTAQYSGDSYNNGFTTLCSAERTQILAKDAYDGGRDDFLVPD